MSYERYPLSGPTPRHGMLHEGVPVWMRDSIRDWLHHVLEVLGGLSRDPGFERTLAGLFDLHARLETPLTKQLGQAYLSTVVMSRDEELVLDFIDFLLPGLDQANLAFKAGGLDDVLSRGGSIWRVAVRDERLGLERRVGDTAIAAADKAIAEAGHAGKLLEEAWQKVFGRQPDPKGAYSKAVLAVEEAAAPCVTPKDKEPTLGKIAGVMRDHGDWRYVLHEGGKESAKDAPLHQVQELWHRDARHADGTGTYRDPSPEEAETAVFLAVGLVHLFKHGLIARKP